MKVKVTLYVGGRTFDDIVVVSNLKKQRRLISQKSKSKSDCFKPDTMSRSVWSWSTGSKLPVHRLIWKYQS